MDPFDLREWQLFNGSILGRSVPAIVENITIDSRRICSPYTLFVALPGLHCDGHDFVAHAANKGAKYALVREDWKPGLQIEGMLLIRAKDPLRAFQELAALYRKKLPAKIIGITGSFGKTMVKDLLELFAGTAKKTASSPESFNSQIGVPLSLFLIGKEHDIALIEAGISQESEMDRLAGMIQPDFGILTHIGKKHLSTLGSVNTIAEELSKLFTPCKGWILAPKTDLFIRNIPPDQRSSIKFWNEDAANLPHACYSCSEKGPCMPYQVKFPDGNHYAGQATTCFTYFLDLINIAMKAAWVMGISSENICKILKTYSPEPSRIEIWKSPIGATFINDTYCSDPQSVDIALEQLSRQSSSGRKIFIFGGMRSHKPRSEIDYKRTAESVIRNKADCLIAFGPHPFPVMIQEINKKSDQIEMHTFKNYGDAIQGLQKIARKDDIILVKGDKKEPLDTIIAAFNDSICSNQLIINLAAVKHNIQVLHHKLGKSARIMPIIKALSYGTNDIQMAKFLGACGIEILGVSYVDEGVSLRRAGIQHEIFVLNSAIYEASKVCKWGLQVGVSDRELIEALAKEAALQRKTIGVHLHINTGMSRFGCRPEDALSLARQIVKHPSLKLEGVLTHFSCADDPSHDDFTHYQAASFNRAIQEIKRNNIEIPWVHASNSSGTLRFNFTNYNMSRVGLALYGLHSNQSFGSPLELQPALSLCSRIAGINVCKKGESISYGRTYTVQREEEKIAVLPIGYFDGLHRSYSGKGHVIIRGKKAPMVGKICMDYMMVDVTEIPNAAIGDIALLFGEDEHGNCLPAEEFASNAGTIVHELITCLGPRIQRVFIHEEVYRSIRD